MAIAGVGSWLPTIDEFLAHWQQVLNSAGSPVPNLSGGYVRANLETARNALAPTIAAVQSADNARQTARVRALDEDRRRAARGPDRVRVRRARQPDAEDGRVRR